MSKPKQYITLVLDETGSMQSCKQQTISGFNEYIQSIKAGKGAKKVRFTLIKFNSYKKTVVCEQIKLDNVSELNDENYRPNEMTPLFDAVGEAIKNTERYVTEDDKVLIVIQTDGLENDSKEYTQESIAALIKEKKDAGWNFVFLGADQNAWAAGRAIGLSQGNVLSYASAETAAAFDLLAIGTRSMMEKGGEQTESFYNGKTDIRQ